jgi:hypothetical protein
MTTEIASLAVEMDSTSVETSKKRMDEATASGERLEKQTDRLSSADQAYQSIAKRTGETLDQVRSRFEAQASSQQKLTQAVQEQSKIDALAKGVMDGKTLSSAQATQAILILESAQREFNKEANDAVDKLRKMGGESEKAGEHLGELGLHGQRTRMHLLMLFRDLSEGHLERAAHSFMQIASHSLSAAEGIGRLAGPAAAAAAAIGMMVKHAYDMEKLDQAVGRVMAQLSGGGNSGAVSRTEIKGLIEELQTLGNMSEESSVKVVDAFSKQHTIGRATFLELTHLVPDFARAMGVEAPVAADRLAKALADPFNAGLNLDKELNVLTFSQYKQILAMKEHGDAAGAQGIIIQALHQRFDGLRNEGLTPLQKAWDELKNSFRSTNEEGERSNTMMDNLAKNMSLMADVVKTMKGVLADFAKFIKDNPIVAGLLGLGPLVAASAVVDLANRKSPAELEAAEHDKWLREMAEQDKRAIAAQQARKDQEEARRKERYPQEMRELKEYWAHRRELEGEGEYQAVQDMEKEMKERERLRKEDIKSTAASIDAQIEEYERGLRELGKRNPSATEASDKAIKDVTRFLDSARGVSFANDLGDGFGKAANSLGSIVNILEKYEQIQRRIDDQREKAAQIQDPVKRYQVEAELQQRSTENQLATYGQLASAAAGFFDSQSKGYQVLMNVSKAFHMAEIAMQLASIPGKLMSGAATMFGQSGWGGFAGVAAMLAVMGGLGYAASGGFGGAAPNLSQQRQATQGSGSVLGDPTAKSDSLNNTLHMLLEHSSQELEYELSMTKSLLSIDQAMSGLAAIIARSLNIAGPDTSGLKLGSSNVRNFDDVLFGMGPLGRMAPMQNWLSSAMRFTFGSTSQSLNDSGINIPAQTLAQAISHLSASQYADITTTNKPGLLNPFHSGSSTSRSSGNLDPAALTQIQLLIGSVVDAIVQATHILTDQSLPAVRDYILGLQLPNLDISLKDLKGEELQHALETAFSKMSDDLAAQVIEHFMPGVSAFQKVGEGLFQTLVRVASGVEQARGILERFHITAINYKDISNKQGDVATEMVRQSILQVETAVGGALTGVGKIIDEFQGSVEDLANIYQKLLDIRVLMRAVGMDANSLNREMIEGAGGVSRLTQGLQSYYQEFFTVGEQQHAQWEALSRDFAALGVTMPTTRSGFRALIDSISDATPEGARLRGQLIALAPAFANATSAAQDLISTFGDLASQLFRSSHGAMGISSPSAMTTAAQGLSGLSGTTFAGMSVQQVIQMVSHMTAEQYQSFANQNVVAAGFINTIMQGLIDQSETANQAAEEAAAAQQAAAAQAQAAAEQQRAAAQALKDARQAIKEDMHNMLIGGLSPLSPQQQFLLAKKKFDDDVALAKKGDLRAMQALGGDKDTLLGLGQQIFSNSGDYAVLFQQVYDMLGQVANPTNPIKLNKTLADALPVGSPMMSQGDAENLSKNIRGYLSAVSSDNKAAIAEFAQLLLRQLPVQIANAVKSSERK